MRTPEFTVALALSLVLLPGITSAATLTIHFEGDAAEHAAVVSTELPPPEGGMTLCGQGNQGSPSCALRPDQQCCVVEIPPDLEGAETTLIASDTRSFAAGGVYFMAWGGICAQPPVPCSANPVVSP